ncbi:MAG: dicarboxylate/amino acid:cation symporter, partial [Bdellovibrionales bacterium]
LQCLGPLSSYFGVVLLGLLIHFLFIYFSILKWCVGADPILFIKKFKSVMLLAYSTSSSQATLSLNMSVTEKKLGVNRRVSSFTLPLGATINMDGTAIMQGVATVFIAQVYG